MNIAIKEFAEKYNFVQIDIDNIVFNEAPLEMHNKNFISINECSNTITCGKINIQVNTEDEEERYYIDRTIFFILSDCAGLEAIMNECKKHKLI